MMKKIISTTTLLALLACIFTFSRCSDDDYTEKYVDPNKITSLLMEKVMTGVLIKINDWAIMSYGRYYSYDNLYLANFTQSFGRPFSNTMYYNGWSDDGSGKYSSLLSAVGLFKKLEAMYNDLTDVEKPAYEAYYIAAKTHLYAYLLAMLDLYGDIPFTYGGLVAATGDINNSNAHFDHAEDLYKMIIDETKEMGIRFSQVTKPKDFTASSDFVNDADFERWQKEANSVRLRAAIRVASQGVLTDVGRAAIKEILENPTLYPIVENNDENVIINNLRNRPGDQRNQQGFDEGDGSNNLASDDMVSRMLSNYDRATWSGSYQDGVDDPRVALLYDLSVKEPNTGVGYPSYKDADGKTITQSNVAEPTVFRGRTYEMPDGVASTYSGATTKGISYIRHNGMFWNNAEFDHQIITASELWFIKAEAYLNGWANGDAKAAFKEGVKQSIKFYFLYHNIKTNADDAKGEDGKSRRGWVLNPDEPDDDWIDAFAEARWATPINSFHPYTDQLDAIITQKYIHYSIFFVQEAWNDIRRTGYPSGLYFPTVSDANRPNVPVRLRYPTGERDFNKNFSEVNRPGFNADDFYTKLFWAK
jgi:hypothetical protein